MMRGVDYGASDSSSARRRLDERSGRQARLSCLLLRCRNAILVVDNGLIETALRPASSTVSIFRSGKY